MGLHLKSIQILLHFKPNEESVHIHGEFSKVNLLKPWDVICDNIMRYISLEDRFQVL